MKKALMIIAMIAIVVIAGSLLYYFVFFKPGVQQETAKATIANTTTLTVNTENITVTVDTENQSKINDYKNRLKEFFQFLTDYNNATQKIDQDIADLDIKRIEAAKAGDIDKTRAYIQVEMDKNEEAINSISKIYVPEIAKDFYSYRLDYYTKYKQWYSYLLPLNSNFDVSKSNSLKDEADIANIKAEKELQRVVKGFNQEAQELGLSVPFPQ